MKLLIIISIFLLLPNLSYGRDSDSLDVDSCISQGKELGDGSGPNQIDDKCFDLILEQACSYCIDSDEKAKLKVVGFENIVFIQNEETKKMIKISGKQSRLQKIISVDLDAPNQRVLVADGDKNSIYTFDIKNPGNVAPLYFLSFENDELVGMSNASYAQSGNYIDVVFPEKNIVKVFSSKASIYGKKKENLVKPLRFYYINQEVESGK